MTATVDDVMQHVMRDVTGKSSLQDVMQYVTATCQFDSSHDKASDIGLISGVSAFLKRQSDNHLSRHF